MSAIRRMTVSIKENLANSVEEISKRTGKSASTILSESVTLYVEAKAVGLSAENAISTVKIMNIMKEINAVPFPSMLLDFVITHSTLANEPEAMKKWYERGVIVGNIIGKYVKSLDELRDFVNEHRMMIPIDAFELITRNDQATLIVSGVGYSKESATATAEGIKGLLSSFGHEVTKSVVSEGFVKIESREK